MNSMRHKAGLSRLPFWAAAFVASSLLVEAADRALYAAKESGRDRLIMADEAAVQFNAEIA
jgi:GGDEF domain-containing protein